MPKGIYFDSDLRAILHLYKFRVAIDVGAYHGWMTDEFLKVFPNARVIAVEPTVESYNYLTDKFAGNSKVIIQNCAAGSKDAVANFRLFNNGQLNSFKSINNDEAESIDTMEVPMQTIEAILKNVFPERRFIDFLKIDVEGFEMECLAGAKKLLENDDIGCILIEVGFCDDDERHTPFKTINEFLTANRFAFYGLYDLYHYRKKNELLFANALFLNENYLVKNNLLK